MSVDLDVKVTEPLFSADVVARFKQVMASLLNVHDFVVDASILDHGEWRQCDALLAPEEKKLRLHIPPNGYVDVMLFQPFEDIGDISVYASISVQGKDSALRAAMLGGCAITVARLANSPILDHCNFFSTRNEYTAQELTEILKCRRSHDTVEEAAQEVLGNIEQAKATS